MNILNKAIQSGHYQHLRDKKDIQGFKVSFLECPDLQDKVEKLKGEDFTNALYEFLSFPDLEPNL